MWRKENFGANSIGIEKRQAGEKLRLTFEVIVLLKNLSVFLPFAVTIFLLSYIFFESQSGRHRNFLRVFCVKSLRSLRLKKSIQ